MMDAVSHENSIRIDEGSEKEQEEGRRLDSGDRNEISNMEVEQDVMGRQLQAHTDAEGVVRTPETRAGSEATPQTTEKVMIPQFVEVVTGKEFMLPDARSRSRRD